MAKMENGSVENTGTKENEDDLVSSFFKDDGKRWDDEPVLDGEKTNDELRAMSIDELADLFIELADKLDTLPNPRYFGRVRYILGHKECQPGMPLISKAAIRIHEHFSKNSKDKAERYTNEEFEAYRTQQWPGLTVGQLRKKLEGLPDDMLVMYHRIEDFYFRENHWKVTLACWEKHYEPAHLCEYIRAWSAYPTETEHGDKVFTITAHY